MPLCKCRAEVLTLFPFFPWAVVANSDESQLLTPGKMSQRQGKEAYPTPTKELCQASFSPASPHNQGKKLWFKCFLLLFLFCFGFLTKLIIYPGNCHITVLEIFLTLFTGTLCSIVSVQHSSFNQFLLCSHLGWFL